MLGNKFKNNSAGFTVIEIIVAIAMFSLVSAAALGIFTSTMKAQKRILANQELIDQTSYVLEYMSRSLRMAIKDDKDFGSGTDNCLSGNKANYEINPATGGIRFRNYNDECQEFYLESGRLMENNGSVLPLTSADLTVDKFQVSGAGWGQGDNLQPSVTIFLEISGKDQTKMIIQTIISQRNLDVTY